VGSLLAFFSLTYLASWGCFYAVAALSRGAAATVPAGEAFRGLLLYLGIFAPALVALALTARAEGRAGAQALLRRILRWQVGVRWYVFAAGFMAAIKLSAALVARLSTGAWPRFGSDPWYLMLLATAFSTPVQAGEEIGWRGYALPRLAERIGLGAGSVVLGIIWAAWHLPFFYLFPEGDTFGQSFPVYLAGVTAMSVAMAWLYGKTQGSLLLVMLLHAAVNNTKDIVPSAAASPANPLSIHSSPVGWLALALLWLAAAYFLIRMPKLDHSS
jgi:membrane protease YdiL (CAAX protease family)